MISVDTNILIYAANPAAKRHKKALAFMNSFSNKELVICELVLVELYMALRNPAVFPKPYTAKQAADYCMKLKTHPKWLYVDYEPEISTKLWTWAKKTKKGFRQIIDARIAITLQHHGVTEFSTANIKDFEDLNFDRIWDPSS